MLDRSFNFFNLTGVYFVNNFAISHITEPPKPAHDLDNLHFRLDINLHFICSIENFAQPCAIFKIFKYLIDALIKKRGGN